MQIITGKYRSRKLLGVDSTETRPTLARVKESVFNLIQFDISGATVLDLFAGSGAFGAECISRGAKKVYFVDKQKKAIETIKINTKNMIEDFEIVENDYISAIKNFSSQNVKFDLVYLDPPYKSDFLIKSLELLSKYDVLSNDAIIVAEHKSENDLQKLPSCYIIKKSKKYGIALIDILLINKEK